MICRNRSGITRGHCFDSLEDESGISNLVVRRKTFEAFKLVIVIEPFLLADGPIQISEGPADRLRHRLGPLAGDAAPLAEFHEFQG